MIALVLAFPVGVGSAIFLAEAVSGSLRLAISIIVELLAAIPSVVFGLWGYVLMIPFLGHYVFPAIASVLGFIPAFAGSTGSGYGLLTAGIVLSPMIVPLIVATMRDAIAAQRASMRKSALALGATRFETAVHVLLPGTRKVLIGATFLALGRALGETMAVLMVSGNALNMLPNNIYAPVSTMAAFIVSQFDSALEDPSGMAVRSLAEIALVLSVISIVINVLARVPASLARPRPVHDARGGQRGNSMASVSSADVLSVAANHRHSIRWTRRIFSAAGWAATGVTLLLLIGMMLSILGTVLVRGFGALSPSLFVTVTQNTGGGLLNAIEGSTFQNTA